MSKELSKVYNIISNNSSNSGQLPTKERFKELLQRVEKEYDLLWDENQDLKLKIQQLQQQLIKKENNVSIAATTSSSIASPTNTTPTTTTTTTTTASSNVPINITPSNPVKTTTAILSAGESLGSKVGKLTKIKVKSSSSSSSKNKSSNNGKESKRDGSHKWLKIRDYDGHRDGIWEVSSSLWDILSFATCSTDRTARIWTVDGSRIPYVYIGHTGAVNSVRFHPSERLLCTSSGDRTCHIFKFPTERSSTTGGGSGAGGTRSPLPHIQIPPSQHQNILLPPLPLPSQPPASSSSSSTSPLAPNNQPHSPIQARRDRNKLWTPLLGNPQDDLLTQIPTSDPTTATTTNFNEPITPRSMTTATSIEAIDQYNNYRHKHNRNNSTSSNSSDSDDDDDDETDDIIFNRYDDYLNQQIPTNTVPSSSSTTLHSPHSPEIENNEIKHHHHHQLQQQQLHQQQVTTQNISNQHQKQQEQQNVKYQQQQQQQQQQQNQKDKETLNDQSYIVIRQPSLELKGHNGPVIGAAWLPSNMLITASWDNTVRWWSTESGKYLSQATNVCMDKVHKLTNITSLGTTNNALTSSTDGVIRIWDYRTSTNSCIQSIHGHSDGINTAAYTFDSNFIVSGGDDRTVKVWDIRQTKTSKASIRCPLSINRLSVSQSSSIAIPQDDGRISVYDIHGNRKGKMRDQYKYGHKLMATSTAWSNDDSVIFSASFDRRVISWAYNKQHHHHDDR